MKESMVFLLSGLQLSLEYYQGSTRVLSEFFQSSTRVLLEFYQGSVAHHDITTLGNWCDCLVLRRAVNLRYDKGENIGLLFYCFEIDNKEV